MTDRELMQQALEALVQIHPGNMTPMAEEAWNKAIALLGERLSQPDQEPVAWMYEWDGRQHLTFTDQRFVEKAHPHFNKSTPLFTYPPTCPPLATEEIEQCCYEADSKAADHPQTWKWTEAFARAIQSKLKERNT